MKNILFLMDFEGSQEGGILRMPKSSVSGDGGMKYLFISLFLDEYC